MAYNPDGALHWAQQQQQWQAYGQQQFSTQPGPPSQPAAQPPLPPAEYTYSGWYGQWPQQQQHGGYAGYPAAQQQQQWDWQHGQAPAWHHPTCDGPLSSTSS